MNLENAEKMIEPGEFVIVLTTVETEADAGRLARTLVEERLAACVNILAAMTSVYRWQGRIQQEHEHQLVMKTQSARIPALQARLRELHPYDVPELLVVPVMSGSEEYLGWVRENT
jgi:periplasmic divalent cation tolerance protein